MEDFLVGLLILIAGPRNSLAVSERAPAISTGWPDEVARRWRKLIQTGDSPLHVPYLKTKIWLGGRMGIRASINNESTTAAFQ